MNEKQPARYSPPEEMANRITHGIGLGAACIYTLLLGRKAVRTGSVIYLAAGLVFGISLITLYLASTLYHSAGDEKLRRRLKLFDHISIYLLIAGTYTPFTLAMLGGRVGHMLFWSVWGAALAGIILKVGFIGRFRILSALMYVVMGWMAAAALGPLKQALDGVEFFLLIGGGAAYTVGAIFYMIRAIPFGHALFHGFVLVGSGMHAAAVYHWGLR